MKKILGVFLLICSMLFGIVPSYAETTHDIDLLVEPYLTTMKEFNQEMGTQYMKKIRKIFIKYLKNKLRMNFGTHCLRKCKT